MADMRWNFGEVYTKVAEYLGADVTDSDDLATVKDIVYRGYMKFLMPVSPKDEEIYVWSWLRQPWKMALEPNKWEYALPKDFDRFYRKIEYDGVADGNVMSQVSERSIMRNRSNLEFTTYPYSYALRTAKFDKVVGSVKEMIVYPTPANRSVLNSTYVMTPDKPETTTDYFVGGPVESEAILQCCLAVAENQEDEKIGVETKKAIDLIQALIKKDKGEAPDTVGQVRDTGLNQVSIFDYRSYWIPSGTYTVYGYEI